MGDARPLFLAVFRELQVFGKNLHATKKLFQHDDQSRPVDGGHERVLRDVECDLA
jgi:hypothetical protein